MMKPCFLALPLLALQPALASAQSADLVAAIKMAGSPRMAAHLLAAPGQPPAAAAAGQSLLDKVGYGEEATEFEGKFTASPFLRYDANLNGGFPDDHVMAGGLRFDIAERDQAVAGLIGGVTLGYAWRKGLGGRTLMEGRANLLFGRALEENLTKAAASIDLCVKHRAKKDTYLHACVDAGLAKFELGESRRVGARVGVTQIVSAFGGVHEIGLEARREKDLSAAVPFERNVFSLTTISAIGGPAVLSARLEFGAPVEGVIVMRERVQLGVAFDLMNKPASVTVDYRRSAGGTFLGVPREDRTVSVALTTALTDKMTASVGVTRNNSTASPYNRTTVDLGLNLKF